MGFHFLEMATLNKHYVGYNVTIRRATIQSDYTVKCQPAPRYADDKHMENSRSNSQYAKKIRTYVMDFINYDTKSENEIKKL